ncbi:MAG: dihydrodipicolinate synthase family protein [Nitrososphaeria archaeon]
MDFEKTKEKLTGPAVSIVTPLKQNFELDLDGLRKNIRFLTENGFVNGKGVIMAVAAAGEAPSLKIDERKAAMKAVADEAKGKVPLVTSAQDPSIDTVIELSNYAGDLGYDAVQISPPFYFPVNAEAVYRFFKTISERTKVGIMVYNTPWANRGFSIDLELMDRLTKIDSIVSFKWRSNSEVCYLEALKRYSYKIPFLINTIDPISGYLLGAKMHLAIPANFAPTYSIRVGCLLQERRFTEALDELFKLHIPYYRWIEKVESEGVCGEGVLIKSPMEMVGLPAGPAKPPYNYSLNPSQEKMLREILVNAGLKVVK